MRIRPVMYGVMAVFSAITMAHAAFALLDRDTPRVEREKSQIAARIARALSHGPAIAVAQLSKAQSTLVSNSQSAPENSQLVKRFTRLPGIEGTEASPGDQAVASELDRLPAFVRLPPTPEETLEPAIEPLLAQQGAPLADPMLTHLPQPEEAIPPPPMAPPPAASRVVERPPIGPPQVAEPPVAPLVIPPLEELPPPDAPFGRAWWDANVARPIRTAAAPWEMDLDGLLMIALENSEHVLAISLEPVIRETEIARQAAQFDTTAYLDSKMNGLNDPVGNTLTTGGPSRYIDDNWFNRGGFKRLNWYGGQAELAQELGMRDTNSVFFLPANQANMRMVLSYTQPLMRGRGRAYNESVIVLAQADTEIARRDLQRQLQEHFYQVSDAYWRLWLERAKFLQQQAAATTTANLLRELEARRDIDVLQSHILRARGAMAVRQAAVQRAELAVRNQEVRLWALTGAQELHVARAAELVPQALPSFELPPMDRDASVQEALQQRPEITATLEKIRAAQTKLDMATHELMPALNLALQGYAHGLNGNFDLGQAFLNQFTRGAPGYIAGVYYEAPMGNAAAQARLRRRQLEARQLAFEFEATLKSVSADVDNALRDIEAARATANGQHQAMVAARAELDYLLNRWRMMPGEDRATSLMLDESLDALDRLVAAENALAQAQVDYAMSLIQFKRATGQLFQVERVGPLPHSEVLIGRQAPAGIEIQTNRNDT